MDTIFNLGINFVLWLQGLGTGLFAPMTFFTTLGYEQFYLLVAPILFWSIDPGLGLRVGLGLMISNALNSILKLAFHGPRPYWYDQRVAPLSSETSFGAPSGHAQNAVVFWGLIAARVRRWWAWGVALLLILLISVSRLYLGMHFPHDTLIGWLAGILIVWLTVRFEKPVLDWFRLKPIGTQMAIILASSLAMIAVAGTVRGTLSGFAIPLSWEDLAGRVEPIDPFALSGVITASAVFFGLASGAILLAGRGWLDPDGTLWQHVARYLLGLVGMLVFWYGLDMIFPTGETFVPYIFRFLRYGLVGFWVAYLAPLVFFRLGLAKPKYALPPKIAVRLG